VVLEWIARCHVMPQTQASDHHQTNRRLMQQNQSI
jgi:hypothetical protein